MSEARQVSAWNVPNALTVLRILMVPVFVVLLLMHGGQDVTLRLWALGVFLLAMLTDKIDGDLARKYDIVTDFGKLADPIADKALMAAAFIGLSIVGALPWWIPTIILIREFGITILRMLMVRRNVVMPASKGGKLKTVLQTATVALYLAILPLNMWASGGFMFAYAIICGFLLAATVLVTLITGAEYCYQAYVILTRQPAAQSEGERPTGEPAADDPTESPTGSAPALAVEQPGDDVAADGVTAQTAGPSGGSADPTDRNSAREAAPETVSEQLGTVSGESAPHPAPGERGTLGT